VLLATIEYNKTVHSVTNKKPVEIIQSTTNELEIEIKEKIQKAQEKTLDHVNKDRAYKSFQVEDTVWLKTNKRLGNKL